MMTFCLYFGIKKLKNNLKNSAVPCLIFLIELYYLFQTSMISLEALPKIIDTSQLTSDLEGTLHYDHAQWIDMRLVCIF